MDLKLDTLHFLTLITKLQSHSAFGRMLNAEYQMTLKVIVISVRKLSESGSNFTLIQTGKTDLKLDSLHLLTLITKLQSRSAFCIQCSAFCKIPLSFGHPSTEYMSVDYHLTWRPTNGSTCRPTLDHMSDKMLIDNVCWRGMGWYFGILVNTRSIRQVSSVSRILVDCQWHNSRLLYNVICVNQNWHCKNKQLQLTQTYNKGNHLHL